MCARSVLPLGSVSAKKSIGKELTFYDRGGRQKARLYSKPSGEASEAQAAQRLIIKAKVEAWQALSSEDKAAWNAQAKTRGDPWSGYTLFMSLYEAAPPPPPEQLSIFNFRITGRYHCTGISGPDVIRVVNASYVYALPFFCGGALTFDRIAFFCTKKAARSGVFLGVYLDNDSIYPGSLVLTSDMLDAQSVGLKETVVDWTSVADKLYWLVFTCNKGPTVKAMSDYRCFGSPFGMPNPLSSHQLFYYYDAWAFDVLPETFPGGAINGEWVYVPAVFLRAA